MNHAHEEEKNAHSDLHQHNLKVEAADQTGDQKHNFHSMAIVQHAIRVCGYSRKRRGGK